MKNVRIILLLGLLLAACQAQEAVPPSGNAVSSEVETPISSGTAGAATSAEVEQSTTTNQMTAGLVCDTLDERAAGYFNRGVNLQTSGNIEGAKDLYLQAIDLDPGYCDAMDNLGLLLRQQGNLEEAIEWYLRSIELAPHNTVARMNLAVAYSYQGKTDREREQYELIIEIDPSNPEGYYGLAGIQMDEGHYPEAISLYAEAAALYEIQGSIWVRDAQYGLGISLASAEQCVEAVEVLGDIYDEFIYDAWVNYHLGYCYLDTRVSDPDLAELYLIRSAFLGMELPEEVWEFLPRFDLQIGDDLWLTYGYFGIIVPDDQGGFFFPTDEVPYREGIEYAWMIILETPRSSVSWMEEYQMPAPPQSWGSIEANGFTTISEDGRMATTNVVTELVEPVIGNSWILERGDPLGKHEMRIYVEGEYVTTFEFEVGYAGESS